MNKRSTSFAQLEAMLKSDFRAFQFAVKILRSNPQTEHVLDYLSPENAVFHQELRNPKLGARHRLPCLSAGDLEYIVILDEKFLKAKIIEIEIVDPTKPTEMCFSVIEVAELHYVMDAHGCGTYEFKRRFPMDLDNVTVSSNDIIDQARVESMRKLFHQNDGFEEAIDTLLEVQAWAFKE